MSAELPRLTKSFAQPIVGPARGRIGGWEAFWILALVIGGLIFLRDLINAEEGYFISGGVLWGRDFVNVYTSGSLALQGRLDILYDVYLYQAFQVDLFAAPLQAHNYSYPPVTLLYTWLFALLPYPVALASWLVGTGALFAFAARPYLRGVDLPLWVALLAPASILNLWAGHYGFLIGALWLFAWSFMPRRPALSGMLIGLMIVKPHVAVLAPLVLAWRREWTAFFSAAATVVLLVGLSLLLFGSRLWVIYLTETALLQANMVDDVGAFFLTLMPTLMPSLAIIGIGAGWASLAQLFVAIPVIVVLLRHLPEDSRSAGLATATATFLVLPYAFAYDMTVAGLAGLMLFRSARDDSRAWFLFAAGAAAFVPLAVLYLNLALLPIAPLLIGFQLCALLGLGRLAAPVRKFRDPIAAAG